MSVVIGFDGYLPLVTNLIGKRTAALVQDMTQELINNTPVCTGYAQASWYASPGAVISKNTVTYLGDYVPCLGQIPIKIINLSKYNKIYHQWFVVNLAPYIEGLNEGTSKKQPNTGWIDDIVFKYSLKGLGL